MKLILLSLSLKKGDLDFPLPVARLKSALDFHKPLESAGLETILFGSSIEEKEESQLEYILKQKPDILGLSLYQWNRKRMTSLAEKLKQQIPGLKIIAGGADATGSPGRMMKSLPLDYLIAGEGEEALPELMESLVKGEIPPKRDWLMSSPSDPEAVPAPPVNLNRLSSPFLDGTVKLEEYPQILWELTRGCPYNCSFCFESRGSSQVRSLLPEHYQAEGERIFQSGAEEVFVLDPSFNYSKKRTNQILDWLISREPECHFTFEVRMERLDAESLSRFAQLSCALQIGLQSADPQVCQNINRPLDPAAFRQKAALIRQYDQAFGLDLIYGLPGDTPRGFRDSLNYALSLQPSNLEIFSLSLLEGTDLYDKQEEWGIRQGGENFEGWEHPLFSPGEMREARGLAEAAEELYSFALAAEWLPLLCDFLKLEPVEIMELFQKKKKTRKDLDAETFLEQELGDKKDALPLLNALRLYRGFQLLQEQEQVELYLDYSPDRLDEWIQSGAQGRLSCDKGRWLLALDEEGLNWGKIG